MSGSGPASGDHPHRLPLAPRHLNYLCLSSNLRLKRRTDKHTITHHSKPSNGEFPSSPVKYPYFEEKKRETDILQSQSGRVRELKSDSASTAPTDHSPMLPYDGTRLSAVHVR